MSGPSLADIRGESDRARFPVRVPAGAGSAACFLCAAYLGRQDEIHVHDPGVRDVYLCDLDADTLYRRIRRKLRRLLGREGSPGSASLA